MSFLFHLNENGPLTDFSPQGGTKHTKRARPIGIVIIEFPAAARQNWQSRDRQPAVEKILAILIANCVMVLTFRTRISLSQTRRQIQS